MRLRKKKGFTFIEVIITTVILGLFTLSLQQAVSNLLLLKNLGSKDTALYNSAMNLFELISSGRGFARYALTAAERRKFEAKGINPELLSELKEDLGKYRFIKYERNIIVNKMLKLDGEPHRVRIEREIIEPAPFMFGLKIKVSRQGKHAELKGIISYYDLPN